MAFTQDTFATVGAQAAPSPTVYSYISSDTLGTVTAAGYFNDKVEQLEDGDIILADLAGTQYRLQYTGSGTVVDAGGGGGGTTQRIELDRFVFGTSLVDQTTTLVDTPQVISFSGTDVITTAANLRAAGPIELKELFPIYNIELSNVWGRDSSTSEAYIVYRGLVNGFQIGPSFEVVIDNSDDRIPTNNFYKFSIDTTPTVLTFEFYSDFNGGLGGDDGGVKTFTPGVIGWNQVASAGLTISLEYLTPDPIPAVGEVLVAGLVAPGVAAGATPGSYTATQASTSGSGVGATFTVTVDAAGAVTEIARLANGSGYVVGDTIDLSVPTGTYSVDPQLSVIAIA